MTSHSHRDREEHTDRRSRASVYRELAVLAACAILWIGCGGSRTATDGNSDATATPITAPTPTATVAVPSATVVPTVVTPAPSPTVAVVRTVTAAVTPTATRAGTATQTPLPCSVTDPCLGGRFCELPSGVCGTALDEGICVDVPVLCRDAYAPVCGCDGLTYGNDCLRRGAQVRKSQEGACATVECAQDCDCYERRTFALSCPLECATCDNYWTCTEGRCFEHCGPIPPDLCESRCGSTEQCGVDLFCEKPVGHCDGPGACRQRPRGCPKILDPVCGCDGHTHDNDCERERAGVALAHTGACAHPSVGFVTVRVVDPVYGGVSGVDITIAGTDFAAETNQDGIAEFEIPPGDYFVDAQVCCAGPGHIQHHRPITVETGKTLTVDLRACLRCICASPDTPIATPEGDIPMHALAVGELVYSIDAGRIAAVPIAATNKVPVQDHHVVRLRLSTGAVLEISHNHPTADGRTIGDLRPGDRLADVEILTADLVPYTHDHTYDILPASDSGIYFAAGAPLGSTLNQAVTSNQRRDQRPKTRDERPETRNQRRETSERVDSRHHIH